ncbi:MAG: hypothetical protein AAGJ84_02270 [Pseudomonadota bacterium]
MFKTVRRSFVAATLAVMTMAGFAMAPASAATFDFTGDLLASIAPDSDSKVYTVDGITLTVTAGTFPNANPSDINFGTRQVDQDFFSGLGADAFGDGDNVDGSFGNDVLVFSFSRAVKFLSIDFGNVDGNDDFAFGSVSGTLFSRIVNFEDVSNAVLVSTFATMDQATGSSFGIGAIGTFDNFTIQGIEVAAVPIPAALPLFLSGLFGLQWFARRRRKLAAQAA